MAGAISTPAPLETRAWRWVLVPVVVGALVSLTAGVLARHQPRSTGYFQLFFSDPVHLKAGFATAAAVLACLQLLTAAWIFRKLPWPKPPWVNPAHRWTGRLALAFTLPVAYHCIFKLGFQHPDNRVLAHSLFGCAIYGAFAAKMTILRLHRFPRFVLPVAGGLLFATLIGVWYTSALWLYNHSTNAAPAYATSAPIPADADPVAGETVFTSAGCSGCHTLKAANARGKVGPDLDRLMPPYDVVRSKVERGSAIMPSFKGHLTPVQIRDVAAYVATYAGP